jgi:hypothetical protein
LGDTGISEHSSEPEVLGVTESSEEATGAEVSEASDRGVSEAADCPAVSEDADGAADLIGLSVVDPADEPARETSDPAVVNDLDPKPGELVTPPTDSAAESAVVGDTNAEATAGTEIEIDSEPADANKE